MERPSPAPRCREPCEWLSNRLKTCSVNSGGMPGPSSLTLNTMASSRRSLSCSVLGSAGRQHVLIRKSGYFWRNLKQSTSPRMDSSPRHNTFRQLAEARLESRQREIQEDAQFDRHEPVRRVHKAERPRRRLKILQQRNELSGFDRPGNVIGKRLGDADARARRIARRFNIAHDEPRTHGHGIFSSVLLEPP